MTNLVDQHPLVKAADAKLADLERRRADFEANVAPLAAEDAKAEAEYHKAVDAALLEGAPMPPPLVRRLPEGRDVEIRHGFVMEQRLLTDERRQAEAAAYPDVLHEARRQVTKLGAAARPTVEKLAAVMAEVGALHQAVKVCRTAANAQARNRNDGTHRDQFHDSPLTIEELVRMATGGDPTSILDLTGGRKVQPTDILVQPRNIGMIVGDIQQLIEDTRARA